MPVVKKRSRSVASVQSATIGRFLLNENEVNTKVLKRELVPLSAKPVLREELGDGSPTAPFRLPLRSSPNKSGCVHCHTQVCKCLAVEQLLRETYDSLNAKRIAEVAGARQLCAKSLLPQFVTRIIKLMEITSTTRFVDFGCGNGSVVFQVACETGAHCVGIEISEHNAQVARAAWPVFRKRYESRFGVVTGDVTILTGDGAAIITESSFFDSNGGGDGTAMLLSNLLFPKPLTHFIAERLRSTPVNTRVLCFDDLYPHGRSLAHIRDPEAFELFDMKDYKWQEMSVEWCCQDGSFYIHRRK